MLPNQKHISLYGKGDIGGYYDVAKSMGVLDSNNMYDNTATGLSNQNNHNLTASTGHMLKNSEWGAVAYLASGKYGAGINNVQINSQYQSGTDDNGSASHGVTGCGPSASGNTSTYTGTGTLGANTACNSSDTSRAYNGSKGVLASTTGNIYGVYDMVGGAYEYVVGGYAVSNNQTSTTNFKYAAKPPYADLYQAVYFTNDNYLSNNDQCSWETCGGHALYETKNAQTVSTGNESWGQTNSYFVYSNIPWFIHGGSSDLERRAGLFYSLHDNGRASSYYGFRAALVME